MYTDEQQYWQLIRNGDKQAFEGMFRTYYEPLCNYASRLTGDADEAEESVQNVFFNIWNKKETLQVSLSVKAYLYRAVHNDCLNRFKHQKVRAVYAEDYKSVMGVGTESSLDTLQARELNARINSAIDELPEQCGFVFKLSRFENLKYAEIAAQLNISVKTVENHMGKALKILREKLQDYLPALLWMFIQ